MNVNEEISSFSVPDCDSPQGCEFANKPGAYSLVSRISHANVDPGKTLYVEVYFTGYGVIEGGKLLAYPSPGIFDASESTITFGIKQAGDKIFFGGQSFPMDPIGESFWIELNAGCMKSGWKRPTSFFDVRKDAHLILTETALPWCLPAGQLHGPVTLSLKTKDNAKPGGYDVRFAITYYNGESWVTCQETSQFTVTTWYERWETYCQVAAVVAGLIALISLMLQVARL